jgi:hypothetical protein
MRLTARLFQLLIAIDQAFNTLLGSGWADESLSAFAHRKRGWRRRVINAIFFWQDDHCLLSYGAELLRKQLPKDYREIPDEQNQL